MSGIQQARYKGERDKGRADLLASRISGISTLLSRRRSFLVLRHNATIRHDPPDRQDQGSGGAQDAQDNRQATPADRAPTVTEAACGHHSREMPAPAQVGMNPGVRGRGSHGSAPWRFLDSRPCPQRRRALREDRHCAGMTSIRGPGRPPVDVFSPLPKVELGGGYYRVHRDFMGRSRRRTDCQSVRDASASHGNFNRTLRTKQARRNAIPS